MNPTVAAVIKQVDASGETIRINGRTFAWTSISHFPAVHIRPDITAYPGAAEHIAEARKQFGLNVLNIISYGKAPSLKLPRAEYLPRAIAFYAESYLRQLDFCRAHGMHGTASLHMGSSLRPRGKIDRELITSVVARIKHHPALIAYSYDEPEVRKVVTPTDVIELRRAIKTVDSAHPVCINLCQKWRFTEFAPGSDIASYDYSPFPNSSLSEMRELTTAMRKVKPHATLMSYLQSFQFATLDMPPFDAVYAEFIMSYIDGVRGLLFYSWLEHGAAQSMVRNVEHQTGARAVAHDFQTLIAFTDGIKGEIRRAGDILSGTWRRPSGETLTLAVNLSGENSGTFAPETPDGSENFFDSAWRHPPNRTFDLAPHGTLALRLRQSAKTSR